MPIQKKPQPKSPNLVSIQAYREVRKAEKSDPAYEHKILSMDKVQLLQEMIRFQEERSRLGHLSPSMMTQGKILFEALEKAAETRELQILTRSYRRHLDHEMADYLQRVKRGQRKPGVAESI